MAAREGAAAERLARALVRHCKNVLGSFNWHLAPGAKAEKLMAEIGIAEDRRLKGLGENQVAKLIEALD